MTLKKSILHSQLHDALISPLPSTYRVMVNIMTDYNSFCIRTY